MIKNNYLLAVLLLFSGASICADEESIAEPTICETEPCLVFEESPCQTVYLQGEFIYWKTSAEGMPYVTSSDPIDFTQPFFTGLNDLKQHRVTYGFEPGFRIGAGYHLPYDLWDLFLNWTWFQAKDHSSISASSDRSLWTIWDQLSAVNTIAASAKQKVHLNVLDLELGRSIDFSPAFSMRPFIGLRGALIDQNLNIVYNTPDPLINDLHDLDNDFRAIGLRAGLNLQLNLSSGWGFYGKTAISALASRINVSHNQEIQGAPTPLHPSVSSKISTIKAALEIGAGINWQTLFNEDRFRFMLNLGYEFETIA